MSDAKGFHAISFLLGITTAAAASSIWDRLLLPAASALVASQWMSLSFPGPVSATTAAVLLAGAGWAALSAHPAGRDLSIWKDGDDDFRAVQRKRYRSLVEPRATSSPLDLAEWYSENFALYGPWSEDRLADALARQLTTPFRGVAAETPMRVSLHAVFAMHAARKTEARELLRLLGTVWDRPVELEKLAAQAVGTAFSGPEGAALSLVLQQRHAWSETALMGSLEAVRARGVLSTSEFGWLKYADRGLFFALDAVGRPDSALVEGLGAACQYLGEVRAGHALPSPAMGPAVRGLRREASRRGLGTWA